jgi:hypothetical protein
MNTIQKRKAKKIAYRIKMREKIKFISRFNMDYFFDSLEGYDRQGRLYIHVTNFSSWRMKMYQVALMTYPNNNGQFGLSDTSMVWNEEEGWSRNAPDMGALFVSGTAEDLSDFWAHYHRVEDELTRYTRRERQRNPGLNNVSKWRTFRRPRA